MPAAKLKSPTPEEARKALAKELLELLRDNAPVFSREAGLKASLIAHATDSGASYKEVILDLGSVSVSGAKDAEDLGDLPELNVERYRALSKSRREKLIEDSIIAMVKTSKRASSGRVTPKLF